MIHVGTSGWNYKHWREIIYPRGLAASKWLGRFTETFDTVEVNTSFYRIPTPETVASWAASTPAGFVFALKLWRGITHYRKLRNAADLTERFLDSAEQLPPARRAPLLIQLPPNQGKDVLRLTEYIAEYRRIAPRRWDLAVEFRNASWLDTEVLRVLDRLRVSVCLHDMIGKGETEQANDAPLVYIRRHGTNGGRYAGSYSPDQIRRDAERAVQWSREGRRVYIYYNNDIGGHAWWNAIDLKSAISSFLP